MIPSILLFDIDGTLIDTGGAGRRALEQAFVEVTGHDGWLGFSLAGMTDRAIVRRALELGGSDPTEELLDEILEHYLARLSDEVATTPSYTVHPGVVGLIERAQTEPSRFAVGLGTGNLARGAEIKLTRGELHQHFPFGGFGSDHEVRSEVIRIGAERGAQRLGRTPEKCRVVVIGDTPQDIAAARANDAISIGVATGPYSVEQLQAEGATVVFQDLSQAGAAEAVLDVVP